MKAAVIEHYGSPDEFKIKQLPTPQIENGQILVENKASSVNPIDTIVRQGKTMLVTGLIGDQLLGSDFSGVVIESKSNLFKPGDEVFGLNPAVKGGSYAEHIVADESNAALKPANLSFTQAAVLPLVSLTAWQGLVTEGKIKPGDYVLITGCTGGVGLAAVQIAKTFDAIVTGTCSAKNAEFARSIGVDHVVIYDQDQIAGNTKFDLIFDASGHFTIDDMKINLTEQAMFVSTKGGTDSLKGAIDAVMDLAFEKRMKIVMMKPNRQDLNTISQLAESGKLKAYIAQTFPLEALAQAHQIMQDGGFTGKIAVEIGA
ncbi:NAD(P)-dependent alcohol dehydrogenase [Dyadobacter psychrotolerans]|uniref:NAD(P)-dependent alcohol dehydrogenase n=1 Tax=Dyadobacter psychrotolerans TaxID=2541721 RepID=A0A4R5DV27_9BACT|nr:NAD(P)-dependent alcohol dehydrogenase [Dyadobacter psychrotolerans]TDE14853.1 NAD(P)-dependent alcohol dehydrogenase [Dyadobacter psychrotolerans]